MPRKHRTGRVIPTTPVVAAPPDEADEWGFPPSTEDLPPLPPPPTVARLDEEPSEPPEELVALGPPPISERHAQRWGFRALMLQVHEAALDRSISSKTRRKEVRTILAAASKLYPDAARAEVADTIDSDRVERESRKRAKAAAKVESAPAPAASAKVIPIRRDA